MAAGSLLPLFHEQTAGRMADPSNDGEDFLAELLGGAGDDLMASLLEPNSYEPDQLSLPHTVTTSPPSLPASTTPLLSSIDCLTQPSIYHSPPHDGYISDSSTPNRTHSPYSCTSHSPVDMLGNSPSTNSPNDVMITSAGDLGEDDLGVLLGLSEDQLRTCAVTSSSDIKINVDPEPALRGVPADNAASESPSPSHHHSKAATLVLTEEEKVLLAAEGVSLPTDMPLTKQEQKHLKRVRRKIKNKLSAQESRKRKKEYVEGLEERVQRSTQLNQQLSQKVGQLQSENKSLVQQVQRLQAMVAKLYPTKLQAGTLLMVLGLSFSLIYMPWLRHHDTNVSHGVTVHSRTLLFTEADEFGNLIDPETGYILSEQGGLSPFPPYPWSYQTPAFIPSQRHAGPNHSKPVTSETTLDPGTAHSSLHSTRQDL